MELGGDHILTQVKELALGSSSAPFALLSHLPQLLLTPSTPVSELAPPPHRADFRSPVTDLHLTFPEAFLFKGDSLQPGRTGRTDGEMWVNKCSPSLCACTAGAGWLQVCQKLRVSASGEGGLY